MSEEKDQDRDDERETADAAREERYADVDTSHLEDVEDGCGCTEVWEHTSAEREARREETEADAA